MIKAQEGQRSQQPSPHHFDSRSKAWVSFPHLTVPTEGSDRKIFPDHHYTAACHHRHHLHSSVPEQHIWTTDSQLHPVPHIRAKPTSTSGEWVSRPGCTVPAHVRVTILRKCAQVWGVYSVISFCTMIRPCASCSRTTPAEEPSRSVVPEENRLQQLPWSAMFCLSSSHVLPAVMNIHREDIYGC